MKQLLTLILLLITLTSCSLFRQDMHKRRVAADSSATRSAQASEAWTREVVTEYVPSVPGRTDTLWRTRELTIPQPYVVRVPEPYVVRQIVRESGSKQQSAQEEKTVAVAEKTTHKEQDPLLKWVVALVALEVLILLVFCVYVYLNERRPVR